MKRRVILLSAGMAALVMVAFVMVHPVAWVQAGLIMWDIAAGGGHTAWQDVTPAPTEKLVKWPDGEGDLYRPAGEVRGAMVLVPGAAVLGRDEPRPKALARTFARAACAHISLFLIDDIGHVEFTAVNVRNAWTMWRAIVALLGERRD